MEFEAPKLLDGAKNNKQLDRKLKLTISLLLFVGYLTYRLSFTAPTVSCISDAYHNASLNINRYLVTQPGPAF